jgi:THO complex subunit 2
MKVAGYFDLDPTRMLDLIIDVFSTHLMTHYMFFIHLIRRFTGSRTRLLSEGKQDKMQVDGTRSFIGMDFEDVLLSAEGDVSVVPSSNDLKNPLAQLLGFKFKHYSVCLVFTSSCSSFNIPPS